VKPVSDESILEFPCEIPIKVFGRNEPRFRDAVLEVVRSHFPGVTEDSVSERQSKADRYLSLTITVNAESRDQIDAVFTELSSHEHVIMVL
jgi:putative lipoic acid-binding regulatory protein